MVGTATSSRLGTCSGLGSTATALASTVVGIATRSRLGTCSGLGSPAAAQAPLGLLAASRSSSLRMAVTLGTMLATHAIRQRQACHEGCASPCRRDGGNRAQHEPMAP